MTTTQCTCTGCAVQQGTHQPVEALHQQIDEPQPEALRLADALTVPECTLEYGDCMKAGELLRAQHARIAELESQLEAIGAGGVEPLRTPVAAPQAVQAAVPVDKSPEMQDSAVDKSPVLQDSPVAPAHPAEGVPAAKNGRQVLVDSGALQMVLNALERDALEGKQVRAAMRLELMQSIANLPQPAAQGMEADLTDAQIDEAFNQMPDGAAGFLKSWGYRQFARAVLAAQAKQGG